MTPGPTPSVGVDVGGTKMLGVLLADGNLAAEARRPTPPDATGIVDALADVVADLVSSLPQWSGPVGLGVPALVDKSGAVGFAPNLPTLAGMEVAGRLMDELRGRGAPPGVPRLVAVDNDATCAALAESTLGAAAGVADALVITLGTGIGGALVADGAVRRGAHGMAGEVGHMVVDPAGPPCSCGRRGCWERFASGSGLARLAREAAQAGLLDQVVRAAGGDPEDVRGEHVTAAAAAGDSEAQAVLDELAGWIAAGVANLVLAVDPQMVVLGGGLAVSMPLMLDTVRAGVADLLDTHHGRPRVEIVAAAFGERAGAVGAAVLAGQGGR